MSDLHDPITHRQWYFSWLDLVQTFIAIVSSCAQQPVMPSKFCFTEDIYYYWLVESFFFILLSHCYKIPTRTTSKKEEFTFGSLFHKAKSIATWSFMLELKPRVKRIGAGGECFNSHRIWKQRAR